MKLNRLNFLICLCLAAATIPAHANEEEVEPTVEEAEATAAEVPEDIPADKVNKEEAKQAQKPKKTTTASVDNSTSGKKGFYSQLNLNQEQRKSIIAIKKEARKAIQDAKAKIFTSRTNYQEAFDAMADDTTLTELFKTMNQARQKLSDIRFEQMLKIRAILDDDQKKRFHELKAQFRKK